MSSAVPSRLTQRFHLRLTLWMCLVRSSPTRLNVLTLDIRSSVEIPLSELVNEQNRFHSNPSPFIITNHQSLRTAPEARCCYCTAPYCERSFCKLSLHFALFGLVSRREEWSDQQTGDMSGNKERVLTTISVKFTDSVDWILKVFEAFPKIYDE